MNRSLLTRLMALALCLCLAPMCALADTNDGTPVTRSDFSLTFEVTPENCPENGEHHYADWKTFLNKLAVKGVVDTQSFLSPYSRVYLNGGIYLNGRNAVPFEYDGYYSFRYLRSDALGGASVHFQMFNFFQFMLKGYYFLDLPTQLLALPLYPEATTALLWSYGDPIRETFAGEGDRTVSYKELHKLCETLEQLAQDDPNDAIYYYLSCLLVKVEGQDAAMERLQNMTAWLDFLDPEKKGMTITRTEGGERYEIGGTTLLETDEAGFSLHLPDSEGYALDVRYARKDGALSCTAAILRGEEARLNASLSMDGLPEDGALSAGGAATLEMGGTALEELGEEPQPLRLAYRFSRSADALPYDLTLDIGWLHPETGREALTMHYAAQMEELPAETVFDRQYDDQNDFFSLNEGTMEEYKERFTPTIVKAFFPFVMEMPAGALNDTVDALTELGLLDFLGVDY